MIELNSISKKYAGAADYAVRDITFTAEAGEIIGLLGENGAGKTTILLILSTLIRPSSGYAAVMGDDIAADAGRVRRNIGVLLGSQRLYERLTGRENIAYFAELHDLGKEELDSRISRLSELLRMHEYLDRRVSEYSHGMKQKISLARMLVHDPPVLLLDEPVTGLDLSSLYIFLDFIRECRDLGKTIIFSSHNIEDVSRISDRVLILHKGRLVDQGKIEDICSAYNCDLETLYLRIITDKAMLSRMRDC